MTTVWVLLVLALVVAGLRSVRVVRPRHVAVVERFGRHRRTLAPGTHMLVPVLESSRDVEVDEQQVTATGILAVTGDDRRVAVDGTVTLVVTDPVAALYEVARYPVAVEQLTATALRTVLAGYDVASAETRHHEIEDVVLSVVREAAREWGLDVRRVELGAFEPAPPGTPGTARTLDTTD